MAADTSEGDSKATDPDRETETAPADTAPADTAPADTAPADTAPADTAPADTDRADTDPAAESTAPDHASSPAADSTDSTDRDYRNTESDVPNTEIELPEDQTPTGLSSYPPALIATAVALPVVLIVGLVVAAIIGRDMPADREPLALGPVPAPAATGPACTALLPALPTDLGDYTKSQLVEPAPPATRAWQRPDGGDAIVLRCGLDRPLEFNRASPLQLVNTVQWFEVRDPAATASTWFAVDRETYIALTVPDGSGPTPLQEVSDTLVAHLPQRPIDPGPLPN